MAWTAPMTAASNATFTAAQFNAHVRDNLLETEAAKATGVSNYFVSTGANAVATRTPGGDTVQPRGTTSSTSYTSSLTGSSSGPAVTVTTGTRALVLWSCAIANDVTDAQGLVSVAVSGSSTVAANDAWAIIADGITGHSNPNEPADQHNHRGSAKLFTGLTSGSNTFTMNYKVGSGTGRFFNREIIVYPL